MFCVLRSRFGTVPLFSVGGSLNTNTFTVTLNNQYLNVVLNGNNVARELKIKYNNWHYVSVSYDSQAIKLYLVQFSIIKY